ncbi:MAG: response regulator [Proteobacteria bacterium]|nr:response regulator [Pseudomonadota bacterium]
MRIRNSILYPITGMMVLLILLAAMFHYFAQINLLREAVRISENIKSEDTHFVIQTLIDKETEKLTALSKSLKENDELVWEIAYFPNADDNVEYIKEVMDRLYKELNLGIFIATDRDGKVIYRAHEQLHRGDVADYWGLVEVLEGQDIVVVNSSMGGWSILSMVPAKREDDLYGAIIIGTRIDDEFAREIAEDTDVEVSFSTMTAMVASSLPLKQRGDYIDSAVIMSSLAEEREILQEKPDVNRAIIYAPIRVVDEVFSLIVEMDTTKSQLLVAEYQKRILITSIVVLIIAFLLGIGFTLFLLRPLKILAQRAERTAYELSGEEISITQGNEIQHLVLSFDVLVNTVDKYLSERKKAEDALMDEKERLAVTLRSIGDAVITTDNSGKVILINEVAEELTGWSEGEVIGQPLVKVYNTLDEKTREPSDDFVSRVLEAERIIDKSSPSILKSRGGVERLISEIGAPIRDKENKVIGVVLVFSDITHRVKMEEELLKGRKLESVGILAGGIAHDFNNILTAIMGNVSLAKNFVDPDNKAYKRLEEADRATQRAKDLTHKLLTFSKGGAPIKTIASVAELIKDSAGFTLSGSPVKSEYSFAEDLWPVDIDTGQISQVIQNLCLNASQAMPDGGILQIRAENEIITEDKTVVLEPGNYIKISFSDNGVGISKNLIARIFDPYFTTKQKGSGLGLATVYSIIDNHDGVIMVDSEVDVGTTFTFYLPASSGKQVAVADEKSKPETELLGSGTVLIMDDEEIVREVAGEIIHYLGFEIDFAKDGEEALEKYSQAMENGKPYAVVIMDLTVPGGMGGGEAIKKLLEIDPQTKAIVSSGYSNNPIMANFNKFGFKGVISKPFRLDEVKKTLEIVLNS